MLTDGANFRNICYHTSCDTLEDKLNMTFMSNVVKATLAAMAQLVEIQHADWDVAAFELSSGAQEPSSCGFKLLENDGLVLQADACFSGKILLECYDMKGVLMSEQTVELAAGGTVRLPKMSLPTGVYAFKMQYGTRMFSQKVMIR